MLQRIASKLYQHSARKQSLSAHIKLARTEELFIGSKCTDGIQKYVSQHNYSRILLIASKTLDTQTNEINNIENILNSRLSSKITGITPHNPSSDVYNSISNARNNDIDCIVVIGGGSNTDNAKLTGLFKNELTLNNIDDISNFVSPGMDPTNGMFLESLLPSSNPIIPVLLIPTTLSGTTHIAGCTDINTNKKQLLCHNEMIPRAMIFDPLLTKYTPKQLWLSTGIRAFDHCIETLMSSYSNPYWNGIASNSLKNLLKYLPLCTFDDNDNDLTEIELNARLELLVSAYMSVQSISNGCPMGASHAIGHQLGGFCGVPHGETSCVMTPYVLYYNLINDKDNKYGCHQRSELIKNIFIDVFGDNKSFDKTQSVAMMMHDFINGLNLPRTLYDVGIMDDSKFDVISEYAVNAPFIKANPFPITKKQQIADLLYMAQSSDNLLHTHVQ